MKKISYLCFLLVCLSCLTVLAQEDESSAKTNVSVEINPKGEVVVMMTGAATSWQNFQDGIQSKELESFVAVKLGNVPNLAEYLKQNNVQPGAQIVLVTPLMKLRLNKNTDLQTVALQIEEGKVIIIYKPKERLFWQNFQEEVVIDDARKEVTIAMANGYFFSIDDMLSNKNISIPQGYQIILKTAVVSFHFPSGVNLSWIGVQIDQGKANFELRSEFQGVFNLPSGDQITFVQRQESIRPPEPQGTPEYGTNFNKLNEQQNVQKKPAQS